MSTSIFFFVATTTSNSSAYYRLTAHARYYQQACAMIASLICKIVLIFGINLQLNCISYLQNICHSILQTNKQLLLWVPVQCYNLMLAITCRWILFHQYRVITILISILFKVQLRFSFFILIEHLFSFNNKQLRIINIKHFMELRWLAGRGLHLYVMIDDIKYCCYLVITNLFVIVKLPATSYSAQPFPRLRHRVYY